MKGSLDQIIGFIHAKDILSLGSEEYDLNDLRGLIRKINFIPDFIPIIKQLTEAQ